MPGDQLPLDSCPSITVLRRRTPRTTVDRFIDSFHSQRLVAQTKNAAAERALRHKIFECINFDHEGADNSDAVQELFNAAQNGFDEFFTALREYAAYGEPDTSAAKAIAAVRNAARPQHRPRSTDDAVTSVVEAIALLLDLPDDVRGAAPALIPVFTILPSNVAEHVASQLRSEHLSIDNVTDKISNAVHIAAAAIPHAFSSSGTNDDPEFNDAHDSDDGYHHDDRDRYSDYRPSYYEHRDPRPDDYGRHRDDDHRRSLDEHDRRHDDDRSRRDERRDHLRDHRDRPHDDQRRKFHRDDKHGDAPKSSRDEQRTESSSDRPPVKLPAKYHPQPMEPSKTPFTPK